MPHTSYALLGAIRSHRVDSPSFDGRTKDRPNACNLCHLERSESWAASQAVRWYGQKPELVLDRGPPPPAADIPAGAVFALTGDAAVRAITAAALGRQQSATPATALRAQLLAELSRDEYAAVRAIAERSARKLPRVSPPAPLSPNLVQQLLRQRDVRPVTIAE